MSVPVTGGAGYVGRIVVERLVHAGYEAVVVDYLSTGQREAVPPDAAFGEGDVGDETLMMTSVQEHGVDAVAHMAAQSKLNLSMTNPRIFFEDNVEKG